MSPPPGTEFSLGTNQDVLELLAELVSNQHAFFAGVSREWREAWGELPKDTRAITATTSVSQLQWSFEAGLRKGHIICERIAKHCGVELLQYAHSRGCVLFNQACFTAAVGGKLDMIQ